MISRRRFIAGLSAGAAGLMLPRLPTFARTRRGDLTTLRRGVGTFTSRGGTIGWLINGDGVVIVDSQYPDTAADCLAAIRDLTDRRIDLLVNTHHHGDHTAGNIALKEHADHIVAHRNVPRLQKASAQRNDSEDRQAYADLTYEEAWEQEIGDEILSLRHYGPAHTGGDSVVHFRNADVVHMGDLIFNRMPPFIDRPGGANIAGWIDTLEAVHADFSDQTLFIFGHANGGFEITGGRADLLAMRDFLSGLLAYVQAGLDEGKELEALVVDRLPAFPDYYRESWAAAIPNAIRAAHGELTESD